MTNRSGLQAISLITLLAFATSCSGKTEQEAERSVSVSSIPVYSEKQTESIEETETVESGSETTSEPSWGGGPFNKPNEFDFTISFSEDLVVADYGKNSVNVYQAGYADMPKMWEEEWKTLGLTDIKEWCTGWPITEDGIHYYVQNRAKSIENIRNVQVTKLNELEGYETISERMGIEEDSPILCWTYRVEDFPAGIFKDASWFVAPTDIESVKYTRIGSQYIDGLPVYGGTSSWYCNTYEWSDVMEPSRVSDVRNEDYHDNPSDTCIFNFDYGRYSIQDTIMADASVVNPTTCLDEIKKALAYDPCAVIQISADPSKKDIQHIWEKDVVVYCVELTYAAMDSTPRYCKEYDVGEKDLSKHKLTLVPVWEVYYYITNPMNDTQVADGRVMINAVTGKSLYSDTYGPDKNKELYPELNSGI